MSDSPINIVIGGAAGQGLVTIGTLMSKALIRSGFSVLVTQKYMSRVRGGHNTFAIRVGKEPVQGVVDKIDLLVALNTETVEKHRHALTDNAIVICGDDIETNELSSLRIPYTDLAPKPLFRNTVALGVLGSVLGVKSEYFRTLLKETFRTKGDSVIETNINVLQDAFDWVQKQGVDFSFGAPPQTNDVTKLMLHGNEAIALGALAAGCNFLSFYPMSPSTSVAVTLIDKGRGLGLKYEQVEDEIAAINMALGASYAGGRSIVTTSGGGFALMMEGISMAGVAEIPVVTVVVQRPGPATGMATRTEQGDLNLALYAGHGEFPRAIFAPATVAECFYLTHRAFDLAEHYQTPVFVLSDQYLADSYQDVALFDIDSLPETAKPLLTFEGTDYKRYAVTEDGISPRLIPGFTEALVPTDSHEHDEYSRITEDAENRICQNTKRLSKGSGLLEEVIPPTYYGEKGADLVLLCWGTSVGPCLETAQMIKGKSVGVLSFSQVYPLHQEHFLEYLEEAGKVIGVEGNATGQFSRLIAVETGFHVTDLILRFDGRPLTPEFILKGLDSLI